MMNMMEFSHPECIFITKSNSNSQKLRQANEPGFYEFWRTAERSRRLHNFGHLENLRIE